MIEPYQKSQTGELVKLVHNFENHEVSNPDDDSDLSGIDFRSSTDEQSAQHIDDIEATARVVCFTSAGVPQHQSIAALRRKGIQVREVGSPDGDPYTTQLQIETVHGTITIEKPRV